MQRKGGGSSCLSHLLAFLVKVCYINTEDI